MTATERQRLPEVGRELGARRASQQMLYPKPGKRAEGHLQTARPVHSNRIGVLFCPVVELRHQFFLEAFFAADGIRLCQRHQVLMTVEFPYDFRVADFLKVQIADRVPGLLWRAFTVHPINMPIDLQTVVEVLVAKQIKSVRANLLRAGKRVVDLIRHPLAEQSGQFRQLLRGKEELRSNATLQQGHSERGTLPQAIQKEIRPLRNFLAGALADL